MLASVELHRYFAQIAGEMETKQHVLADVELHRHHGQIANSLCSNLHGTIADVVPNHNDVVQRHRDQQKPFCYFLAFLGLV